MEVQNDMQQQLDTLCSALQGSRCVVLVWEDKKLERNGDGEDFSLWEETSQNNVEGGFSLKTIKHLIYHMSCGRKECYKINLEEFIIFQLFSKIIFSEILCSILHSYDIVRI